LIHSAEGDRLFKQADWHAALECYQKALACLPVIYGIQSWFQHYLLDGRRPGALSVHQISTLYTSLALTLLALNRRLDACVAADAALRIDAANLTCKEILTTHGETRGSYPPQKINSATAPPDPNSTTIVFFTHFTRKLNKYKELAPPSTNLIAACYGSLLQVMGEDVMHYPRLICHDLNPELGRSGFDYGQALKVFSQRHDFDLVQFKHAGLRSMLNAVLQQIRTPTVLLLEHDWLFKGPPLPFHTLISLFDRHPQIHSIRFNKRQNLIAGYDFILEVEQAVSEVPLMRTSASSNNPTLFRTATLQQRWLPLCLNDPFYSRHDVRGTAYGIEEPLFKAHVRDIRDGGFRKTQEGWGTFVYGEFGDPARIVHLGE
jgi:hypothetical protein